MEQQQQQQPRLVQQRKRKAQRDDDDVVVVDFNEHLKLAGYNSHELHILHVKLVEAKKKLGHMINVDQKVQFAVWETIVAERLYVLSNPHIVLRSQQVQEHPNLHRTEPQPMEMTMTMTTMEMMMTTTMDDL